MKTKLMKLIRCVIALFIISPSCAESFSLSNWQVLLNNMDNLFYGTTGRIYFSKEYSSPYKIEERRFDYTSARDYFLKVKVNKEVVTDDLKPLLKMQTVQNGFYTASRLYSLDSPVEYDEVEHNALSNQDFKFYYAAENAIANLQQEIQPFLTQHYPEAKRELLLDMIRRDAWHLGSYRLYKFVVDKKTPTRKFVNGEIDYVLDFLNKNISFENKASNDIGVLVGRATGMPDLANKINHISMRQVYQKKRSP
jgi:hypothetical protein